MRGFGRLWEGFEAAGARVAGVSADSWAAVGAFQREIDVPFEILSDWPNRDTMRTFGVERENGPTAHRVTFVFDRDRVLRHVIDDERNMEAHPEGALAAVQAIAEGRAIESAPPGGEGGSS